MEWGRTEPFYHEAVFVLPASRITQKWTLMSSEVRLKNSHSYHRESERYRKVQSSPFHFNHHGDHISAPRGVIIKKFSLSPSQNSESSTCSTGTNIPRGPTAADTLKVRVKGPYHLRVFLNGSIIHNL